MPEPQLQEIAVIVIRPPVFIRFCAFQQHKLVPQKN
jgi:hypothetical protein